MKVNKVLVENNLLRKTVEDLTNRWFEVQDAPEEQMSAVDKRKAYDEIYDEATDKFFNDVSTAAGYDKIKEFMRKYWLKVGFEAGDGTDPRMNLANKIATTAANENTSNTLNALEFILNTDRQTLRSIEESSFITNLLGRNSYIYGYSQEDIENGIDAISNLKDDSEKSSVVFATGKNDEQYKGKIKNIRGWKDKDNKQAKETNTVEIQKLNDKNKTSENIAKLFKSLGITADKSDKQLVSQAFELLQA